MLQLRNRKIRLRAISKSDSKDTVGGLEITYRDYRELKPDSRNTRMHSQDQLDAVKKSMVEFGWTNPLILNGSKIVAGHGRLDSYKQLRKEGTEIVHAHGYMVPCIQRDDMTEAQRRAYVIADNRLAEMAGWNMELLKDELSRLLVLDKFDVNLTGFNEKLLDYRLPTERDDPFKALDAEDSGVITMKLRDEITFPHEGRFEFSKLRKDRILDISKIKGFATWAGPGSVPPEKGEVWWVNYGAASPADLDWKRSVLGFYVDDKKFECWWEDTAKYCKRMLKLGIIGAITPNYSTYKIDSRAIRIYNTFRSRWVGRYMQEAGIPVVPDVTAIGKDIEYVCAGLKGIKTISLQEHQRFWNEDDLTSARKRIQYILDELKPDAVILYAPADRLRLFPELAKVQVLLVEPGAKARARRKQIF